MKEMHSDVKRLKQFKEEKGWSYEKLGRELGVSFATVIGWMRKEGPAKPNELAIRAIRDFLEKTEY